jgi:hypothetical protein
MFGTSSLFLDGSGAAVDGVPSGDNNVENTTDIAIQFFVFLPTGSVGGRVIGCGTNWEGVNWGVRIGPGGNPSLEWGNTSSSWQYVTAGTAIPLNSWTFITMSITGTTGQIWVNGFSQGAFSTASTARASQPGDFIRIGKTHANGLPFNGYIEELRVTVGYNRAGDNGPPGVPYPRQGMPAIIGNILTSIITNAVSPVVRSIAGSCNASITPSSVLSMILARGMTGFVATRISAYANLSKPVIVPANWVYRKYQCILTGPTDLDLPLSSFNARLTVSGDSVLTLTTHGDSELIDEIVSRSAGDIVITRVHVYSDGSVVSREFIRVRYHSITSISNPKSGEMISVIGRKSIVAIASKTVQLSDVMFRGFSVNGIRYRCAINDEVALGDTAIIDGEQIRAGKINYYSTPRQEFMEISQYQQDGVDNAGLIGNNARPVLLKEHAVTFDNSNYSLWMNTAFYYSGIIATGQTTGQAFTLHYDQDGLLWYLPGYAGQNNFPVLLVDGITQANINV